EREANDALNSAQELSQAGAALGQVGAVPPGSSTPGGSVGLSLNLFDGTGYRWDIQGDGEISDGPNDAYDGGRGLSGFPFFSSAGTEDGGREVVIGPAGFSGASVTRKIYVPADQGFARFLEIVTNPGTTPLTVNVPLLTNLGSDGFESFVRTSSGD